MEFLRFRLNRLCCCAFALGTLAFATLLSVPVSAQDRASGVATDEQVQDLYSRARTAQAAGNLAEAAAEYEEILKQQLPPEHWMLHVTCPSAIQSTGPPGGYLPVHRECGRCEAITDDSAADDHACSFAAVRSILR